MKKHRLLKHLSCQMKFNFKLNFLDITYLIMVYFSLLSKFTLISRQTTTNALPSNQNDVTCHGAFSHIVLRK